MLTFTVFLPLFFMLYCSAVSTSIASLSTRSAPPFLGSLFPVLTVASQLFDTTVKSTSVLMGQLLCKYHRLGTCFSTSCTRILGAFTHRSTICSSKGIKRPVIDPRSSTDAICTPAGIHCVITQPPHIFQFQYADCRCTTFRFSHSPLLGYHYAATRLLKHPLPL